MGYIALALGAAQAIGGVVSASQQSKAAQQQASAQQQAAREATLLAQQYRDTGFGVLGNYTDAVSGLLGEGAGIVGGYKGVADSLFAGVTGVDPLNPVPFKASRTPTQFSQEGIDLSNLAFGAGSQQARSNLDFILGESATSLRDSQLDFSRLASGDTSSFLQETRASVENALSSTRGLPVGSFENLSASNLFNFRTQGTQAALAIGDFFGERGTIDPINPINTIFGLAEFERSERAREQNLDFFNQQLDFDRQRFNQSLAFDVGASKLGFQGQLLGAELGLLESGIGLQGNILNTSLGLNRSVLDAATLSGQRIADTAGAGALGGAAVASSLGQAAGTLGGVYSDYRSSQQAASNSQFYRDFLVSSSNNPQFQAKYGI